MYDRTMRLIVPGIAVLGLTLGWASIATAQTRTGRYTPKRPTVSPYLNLTRRDTGALPNYYALVRPQLEQQALNQQQQATNLRQQQAVQGVQKQVTQLNEPNVRSTGTGAGFSNLSHYFPTPTARGKTNARRR